MMQHTEYGNGLTRLQEHGMEELMNIVNKDSDPRSLLTFELLAKPK